MSSNLTIPRQPFRTPQLKRNAQQFQACQKSAKVIAELPIQSRFQKWTECISDANPNGTKSRYQQRQSLRDDVSTICSSLMEERVEACNEDVAEINELFKEVIEEDLKVIERKRERSGYGHTYQETHSKLEVWVGQPREIPQQVFQAAESVRQSLIQELSHEKINSLQGFISELGLFYYSVENLLMFFDAETMNADSAPICLVKLERRTLEALYGIQVFTLGLPYFDNKKNIMILLHPYEAEMYLYDLKQGIHQVSSKRLDLRPLNCCFPLPERKPNKLCLANNGYLYTTDNKGKVLKIDFQDHLWRLQKKCLETKAVRLSAMTYLKNSTKNIANSLNNFYRSVKNYSLSFFASKEVESELLFDNEREIIVVFIKELVRQWQDRDITQYFHIYDGKNHELLYMLKDTEFLPNKEEIVCVKKMEAGANSKCNFTLLLKSGDRILLDLQSDRLKKHTRIRQPPLNLNEPSRKIHEIGSFFLEQALMAQITVTNHCYLVLVKQSAKESQSITHVKVEDGDICDIHHRGALPIGQRKRLFLQYDKSSTKTENLPQLCRQVYFSPHQLYYSTDQIVQRIIILRPIDIFYSLFLFFSDNIPDFFKKVREAMPDLLPTDIVSICCQLLIDPQGKYYISPQVQFAFDTRNNLPRPWSSGQLDEHCFKQIDAKARLRLLDIMVDSAVNSGNLEKSQLQRMIVTGILQYEGRLFRTIFLTNINLLSSETCKIISCVLQELRKFLLELQRYLKCDLGSYIGKTLRWVNKFWQVVMLAKDIPSLPILTVDEAIVEEAETFSVFVFNFLVQECRNDVFEQIKKLMPSLISPQFAKIYHLYCEVSPMKDPQAILDICKQQDGLPDYFIDYLVKCKRIPEAVLLRGSKAAALQERTTEERMTYRQKMKEFYSTRSSLYEKEQVLLLASILLDEETKKGKEERKEDYQEVQSLRGQLKLQELMIEYYHSRVAAARKDQWLSNFAKFFEKDTGGQQIIDRLNTCLLQKEFLHEIIQLLGCTLLKVMYAYYFQPSLFESVFFSLAEEIFQQHKEDALELGEAFKRELHFMLVKARLTFSFEEMTIILEAYLTLLLCSPSIGHRISSEAGMLQKELFWILTFPAEIGVDANRLYSWGLSRILEAGREGDQFLYLCLSQAYLVRDYLPAKRKELVDVLRCEEEKRVELKQIHALILI